MGEGGIPIEKAAEMLGTSLETMLVKVYELGITIRYDRETHVDFITYADLEDLKESMEFTSD